MHVVGLDIFLFAVSVFLLLWFSKNIITLYALFGIHRSIVRRKPAVAVPFGVFLSHPLREISSVCVVNKTSTACSTAAVYGLTMPLQLHASPCSSVHVKLGSNAAAPVRQSGDAGCPSRMPCRTTVSNGGNGERLSSESLAEGGVNSKLFSSLPVYMGLFNHGAVRCEGASFRNSHGISTCSERSRVLQPVAEPQLSVAFMLESIPPLRAVWLQRVGSTESALFSVEKSTLSLFSSKSFGESTLPYLEESAVAEVGVAESDAGASVELRGVCIAGANDVDIMRAVTVGTTQTFGYGPLSYQCYYSVEDEVNCGSGWTQLLESQNGQHSTASVQLAEHESSPVFGASLQSPRHESIHPRGQQKHHNSNNEHEGSRNQISSSAITFHRGSFGSFSTMFNGCVQSRCCSSKSNTPTMTYADAADCVAVEESGTLIGRDGEDEVDNGEKERSQQLTDLPASEQRGKEVEVEVATGRGSSGAMEIFDDGGFATAISTFASSLSSSLWIGFSTSETGSVNNEEEPDASPQGTCSSGDAHGNSKRTGVSGNSVSDASVVNTATFPPFTEAHWTQSRCRNGQGSPRPSSFQRQQQMKCSAINSMYEGCMYITSSVSNAPVSFSTCPQPDAVEFVLKALQQCYVQCSTHNEGNRVVESPATVETKGGDADQDGKLGKWDREEQERSEMVNGTVGHVYPLTVALLLCSNSALSRSNTLRENPSTTPEHEKPGLVDCFVCVYTTTSTVGDTLAKVVETRAANGMYCGGNQTLQQRQYTPCPSTRMCEGTMDAVHGHCEPGKYNPIPNAGKTVECQFHSMCSEGGREILDAVQGENGVELPMVLQYVRVGEDLYAVMEISDCTFVQYREERIRIGSLDGVQQHHHPGESSRMRDDSSSGGGGGGGGGDSSGKRSLGYRIGTASYSLQSPTLAGVRQEIVRMCWLCLRAEANVILWPCAHFAVCSACSVTLHHCCICQQEIQATILLHNPSEEFDP